jgi:hypothetical protein
MNRRTVLAELEATQKRLAIGERAMDSITRERQRNAAQAARAGADRQFTQNSRDKNRIAWLHRVIADSALPPQ